MQQSNLTHTVHTEGITLNCILCLICHNLEDYVLLDVKLAMFNFSLIELIRHYPINVGKDKNFRYSLEKGKQMV